MPKKSELLIVSIPGASKRDEWSEYEKGINSLIPEAARMANSCWTGNAAKAKQLWRFFYGEDNPEIDCFFHLAIDYLASLKALRKISEDRLRLAEDTFERKTKHLGG